MTTNLSSVNRLVGLLGNSNDFRKDVKHFIKALSDVYSDSDTKNWHAEVIEHLLDRLLSDVLPQLQSSSVQERECIRLIHSISCVALRPVRVSSVRLRPSFQFEASSVDQASAMSPRIDAWFKQL